MEEIEKRTNLSVPLRLWQRVNAVAGGDRRPYKAQIIVLLEEAVAAREKRSAPRQPMPSSD